MTPFWMVLVSLVAGWAIGSAPLGAWWIRRAAGRDPRDLNPSLLGVENVFRLLGPPVAAVGFILDVLKGAVAVVIAPAAGAAAAGVLAGHVFPPPWPGDARAPRGRGNGVLAGALTALVAAGDMPFLAAGAGAAVYAAALAQWGFATPATLLGLLTMLMWPGAPVGASSRAGWRC